jgi:hypothetical protein
MARRRGSGGARKYLERRQRRWAEAAGVAVDGRGFVRVTSQNLRAPLDASALAEIERGSELTPSGLRPARMWSLCSSAALVANVFAYWRDRPNRPLLDALGIDADGASLAFEEPLQTGLEGDPPTSDVALRLPSGRLVAIESKFSEWLVRRPRSKAVFKAKYFPDGDGVWTRARLRRCQGLANDIRAGRERFRFLHAAQLLKHALGLAVNGERDAELLYLYYDWPCREAGAHGGELARFAERVHGELPFRALTYQAVFRRLCAAPGIEAGYLEYLRRRYFE